MMEATAIGMPVMLIPTMWLMEPSISMPLIMNKEVGCNIEKDSNELKCDEKKTLSACADAVGCEWNEGACGTVGFKTLQYMIKADDGSTFHAMYQAAMTCAMKKKSECNGGCKWEAEKGICEWEQSFIDSVCENDHALKLLEVTENLLLFNLKSGEKQSCVNSLC